MEKPCSSFSSSISLGALTLRRFKILEEFTWQLRSGHYHNKENVCTITSAPPASPFLTDTLIASKDPITAALIVMGELFMSTVTPNRFLLRWSVLTRYLFFCWRAIKYLSSVSSAVEAGLSPWHVLPSFRNASTDAHNAQSERCTWAARRGQTVTTQCCTGFHIQLLAVVLVHHKRLLLSQLYTACNMDKH